MFDLFFRWMVHFPLIPIGLTQLEYGHFGQKRGKESIDHPP
jgi:hypothetical protein